MDDVPATLEIPWSRHRLRAGLFLAAGFVILFTYIVFDTPTRPGESSSQTLVFQAVCLILAVWLGALVPVHARRLSRRTPAVVLSRDGILSGNGILDDRFLPWNEIAGVDVGFRIATLKVRAKQGYEGQRPTGGNAFWRALDQLFTRGAAGDVEIPCLMLDIDKDVLADVLLEARRRCDGTAGRWQSFREEVLASGVLSQLGPGLLADAASHGKGLSVGGCMTALGAAGATLYYSVSRLSGWWWSRTATCADGERPCVPVDGTELLTDLFFCALVALPCLLLAYGKIFLPLTEQMVRDGKAHVPFGMPGGPTGRFLSVLNALGWIVIPGSVAALVVLSVKALT